LYRDNYQAIDVINRFISETVEENRARLQEVSAVYRIMRIQEMLPTLMSAFILRAAQYMVPAIVTYKSQRWFWEFDSPTFPAHTP
jgi:hypothetical protein